MANKKNIDKLPKDMLNKYDFITGDFVDILKMDKDSFQRLYPGILHHFCQSERGLIFYLPLYLLENMTPLQISVIPFNFLKKFPETLLDTLYQKYKNTKEITYEDDMLLEIQTTNISKTLKEAFQYKKNDRSKILFKKYTDKNDKFFEMTNMISLYDIYLKMDIGTQFHKFKKKSDNFVKNLDKYEIKPTNYLLYSKILQNEEEKIYNYNEVKKFISENYSSECSFENIPSFCSYGGLLAQTIQKGYLTRDFSHTELAKKNPDKDINSLIYYFIRTGDFPHLKIIKSDKETIKRYDFNHIENFIKQYIETGERPNIPKKTVNLLDFSKNSLTWLEGYN